ncbi:hypothetical protein L6R49_31600, partial [Myxococcota bacterium]|nr:hypothetical protein [Myxococcota bacterium]
GGRRLASGERVELLPGDVLSLSQQLHLRLVQPSRMPTVSPTQPPPPAPRRRPGPARRGAQLDGDLA